MRVVLVATDFTEVSTRAERKAEELARGMNARVHLVHVVEPIDDPDDTDEETREFHRSLEEKASLRLQESAGHFEGLAVSCAVILGHRHQCILREADEQEADVVVLGTHPVEEGQAPRTTTSHRVTWLSRRPVLLVP